MSNRGFQPNNQPQYNNGSSASRNIQVCCEESLKRAGTEDWAGGHAVLRLAFEVLRRENVSADIRESVSKTVREYTMLMRRGGCYEEARMISREAIHATEGEKTQSQHIAHQLRQNHLIS